jgi:hypothetical protein
VLPLDFLDRELDVYTRTNAMDDLLEFRCALARLSPRGRAIVEGLLAGYSLSELAAGIDYKELAARLAPARAPLRTLEREAAKARRALARRGIDWPRTD